MRCVIQRVSEASVTIDGSVFSSIGKGLLVLFCALRGDCESDIDYLAAKIAKMRIFEDENGKMNLSIGDVGGEILCVSQFTLAADISHGNRPSFIASEEPVRAKLLYEAFCSALEKEITVKRGVFGADMKVALVNDGPVTITARGKENV